MSSIWREKRLSVDATLSPAARTADFAAPLVGSLARSFHAPQKESSVADSPLSDGSLKTDWICVNAALVASAPALADASTRYVASSMTSRARVIDLISTPVPRVPNG